jgi:hypothetical protein
VAAAHNKPHTTVGEYLRVADAVTPEVLVEAGVTVGGETDHSRMARLPFSALKGVARSAGQGAATAAMHLLQELRRVGDNVAAEQIEARRASLRRDRAAGKGSFQINIRQPLPELTPKQATHYLGRMSTALPLLAQRAAEEIDRSEARRLATALEEVARTLRGRA